MQSIIFASARVWNGERYIEQDIFVHRGKVVDKKPTNATKINLDGKILLPALVNHHDHLELNHYPRTKFRDVYDNAHQWGEDVNARLDTEPFASLKQLPLRDRLFIGGLKNLLCGALTVLQHGTAFRELFQQNYPVTVIRNYGWSHSLHFDTPDDIQKSFTDTPYTHNWYIHLAEGTDSVAQYEYARLRDLGCISQNTVLVHGVGLTNDDLADFALRTGIHGTIVICPTTNHYLLGAMLDIEKAQEVGINIEIGSDSRLTADGDLLDEYRCLGWHLPHKAIQVSDIANFIVIEDDTNIQRRDIALVVRDGQPLVGNPDLMSHTNSIACVLDGVDKHIAVKIAQQYNRCTFDEQGLIVDTVPQKRFWLF